jgi:hypothetical protein
MAWTRQRTLDATGATFYDLNRRDVVAMPSIVSRHPSSLRRHRVYGS